ncbi:probable DNA mismatch repair protein Msh6 [Cylas formicarius]|uniref:probable DNA mismatch repair protein Msh6 n=1 Tax=Cylas formicarius TaxID=197179 RepID=UPI00295871C0|nr:probable DNA mismatch repair protein Msh6 [Cylas formicarius]
MSICGQSNRKRSGYGLCSQHTFVCSMVKICREIFIDRIIYIFIMKKRTQNNTLFNYFPSPTGRKSVNAETPNGDKFGNGITRKSIHKDDSNDEEISVAKKRSRILALSSDSDDGSSDNDAYNSNSDSPHPKKIKIQKSPEASHNVSKQSIADLYEFKKIEEPKETDFQYKETKNGNPKVNFEEKSQQKVTSETSWLHERLEFLRPNKIMDANRRKISDADYDHHTLYVPTDFLNSLTPAMRQWWLLKSEHFDAVLFFKVGKFYELYHMDAVVGVQELGFSYMKGDFAHSGFPESAYNKMATMLVNKGYKVARVEQTETPELMAERCKNQKKVTKFDKVVAREICQVTTRGTCVYGPQMPEAQLDKGLYMYAICMKINQDGTYRFGICFVDTSIGTFHLAQFDDDKHCSKVLALFAEYLPGLVLTERGANYGTFKQRLQLYYENVMQDALAPKSQFYTASDTLEKLSTGCYFKDRDGNFQWPQLFRDIADDCLPKPEYEMAIKSLGACLWYLQNSQLDIHVFSIGKFELYESILTDCPKVFVERDYMVLDSITIENLSLLGARGSLQGTIDFCCTSFGKRLLQKWICKPLCNVEKIRARQEAVKELRDGVQSLDAARQILKKLPDLERQLAKIHHYGNKFCATDHPDGRAVFYEAKTYSKRKIMDLLKTLRGFEAAQQVADVFKGCRSRLLRKITQSHPDGVNLDLTEILDYFKGAFDHEEAETNGKIIPKRGVDGDYDRVNVAIDDINAELDAYLEEQSSFFGCRVQYFGTDKKRYQLEVPEHRANRANADYQLEGSKKGSKPCRRFSTETTKELLHRMLRAEQERNKIILDLNRRIFEKFSEKYDKWQQVIHCLTTLDVLCSLAQYARGYAQEICIPDVEPFAEHPYVTIEDGRHPCVAEVDGFVPNSVTLGRRDARGALMILTGPNMGGKSTLMRQTATICIMAQIGGFVPASRCSMSLIDRVFTRLGASDDIVHGLSTFFVELTEASTILKHASRQSLLIVDELGRGTSTYDGNAIATAYVQKLAEIECRTLFSTHYHNLVEYFADKEGIKLSHMACMVENDEDASKESVTLLYKLAGGRCPKSFGFNAAKLGGLPDRVVARARILATEIEHEDRNKQAFKKIFVDGVPIRDVRNILKQLTL